MPSTDNEPTQEEAVEKLRELMKDIAMCMLTTVDHEGHLRSRPMAMQKSEFDGDLWFFTGKETGKAHEISDDSRVNVSFAKPSDNEYVSISGTARLVDDKAKAKELWNPFYKAWFPKGLDDPNLTLLRVDVEQAEYWDAPASTVVHLFGVVKAMATGKQPQLGENEKIDFTR